MKIRLIEADKLKEVICSNVYPVTDDFNTCDYGMFWTGGIEKAIDEMPTIEVRSWAKHGKRYVTDAYPHRVYCSECYGTLIRNVEECYEKNKFPRYCMWCGAILDEEDKDE